MTRTVLALIAATVLSTAAAQTYPERSIQMVVPFGAGGTTDIMARLLQDEMSKALGGNIVVVNTAGAGGAIAMAQVARAKPDGYTIAMTAVGPQVIQPARRKHRLHTGQLRLHLQHVRRAGLDVRRSRLAA